MQNETRRDKRLIDVALRALTAVVLAAGVATAQAVPISGQGTWETTLQARDIDGKPLSSVLDPEAAFFYDTVLNLTWLANANMADTTMSWSAAVSWAKDLTMGDFEDWRLPEVYVTNDEGSYAGGTDSGYNVLTLTAGDPPTVHSELAHLWYVTLGNKALYDTNGNRGQSGWGLSNTGPFQNLRSSAYWSGTEYAPNKDLAWYFYTGDGNQGRLRRDFATYALAVRPAMWAPRRCRSRSRWR